MIRRKSNVGMVTDSDAKAAAQSFLENIQVQSLRQHDRKLCFELLNGLLELYSDAVSSLGEDLINGICEAVDAEKDPECLMLAFHCVESLTRLYPDPSGVLSNYAKDIFDILESYFPIHFTHPRGGHIGVQRDELSRALMSAFSSSPIFEPFVIPLLLEKLSSSLLSAKVDSLKYLKACSCKYGAERMANHARAIWSSLKDAISTYLEEPVLSFTSEPLVGVNFQKNEIVTEALSLLQLLIKQNSGLLVSLIVDDEDVNMVFNSISCHERYNDIPVQGKQKIHVVGCILYVTAKTSFSSCNLVFQSLFSRMMDALGFPIREINSLPNDNMLPLTGVKFGFLYLCIELLSGCRDLIAVSEEPGLNCDFEHEAFCTMLNNFSSSLFNAFASALSFGADNHLLDPDIYIGVKGLEILAMFPGDTFPITKLLFENILRKFISVITEDFNKTVLWEAALKALVCIGSFVHKFHESEKAKSYSRFVVEKIVKLLSLDDTMPFPLKLEALSGIGMTGVMYMLKVLQEFEGAVFANLSMIFVHGNLRSTETVIQLLECFSDKLLPWIHENGCSEAPVVHFAVEVWNQIGICMGSTVPFEEKGLLDAIMKVMKLAVAYCSVESQNIIIKKAYDILSSHTSFQFKELDRSPLTPGQHDVSDREKRVVSIFASAVIAVCPQTCIPNERIMLHLFIITLLRGVVPAAQALGSMINKMVSKSEGTETSSYLTLEEALDIIFDTKITGQKCSQMNQGHDVVLTDLCLGVGTDRLLQLNAICGLSWLGKGLLLRGHEKIKDVTMIFLKCLSLGPKSALPLIQDLQEETPVKNLDPLVMKCAADAFHILMSDSEDCLNRKFHVRIRPLYKQRFFSSMMPVFLQLIPKSHSSISRSMLYRAFAHIISDTPLIVVLNEAKKLIPVLLDCLSMMTEDHQDKHLLYGLLLVLSGILTEKNGHEAVAEHIHIIVNGLIRLAEYPHKSLVRETAIQCLMAMSEMPHARIYPMRRQVLKAISRALDDKKRVVRLEAVKCRQAWASIAARSLHF
ncbi:MMS19 nucleotide excision repair protein homolog isoform X2 [Neltuma alba]|nr:MMS19 nucleotide excision repair protein homolog isoform X2 [Prosopis alba]